MCGIVGILNLSGDAPPNLTTLQNMLGMIRHRGPDEFGVFRDQKAGLGSARLSIIDLTGGSQPITNEDERFWIVFNGEIFNYLELRRELEKRGHTFSTQTDTEVIIHLYEDLGPECLQKLNGQFALAIWDRKDRRLFLARDRLGIRPLFYKLHKNRLIFGSEIKSILAYPGIRGEINPGSLSQIFTFWSTLTPHTAFTGIFEIPPAHYLIVDKDNPEVHPYWSLNFTADTQGSSGSSEYIEQLEDLLVDAARIRLRADVPVGAYLSGGLDSSLTTAIIRRNAANRLETFSIAFDNPDYDESRFQLRMAEFLGTDHRVIHCSHKDIGEVFPEVIWHTETPILRTAPAPLFMLSRMVNEHGFKVVLTGEGADEFFGGYDIFKEMMIRRFWARDPRSKYRPYLLRRLYSDIAGMNDASASFLIAFFKRGLNDTGSPFYSHAIRWSNTARLRRFLLTEEGAADSYEQSITLPEGFSSWPHLGQAQYLEASIFLSQYLLSSQGDRMAMAHSVEGRYPFLDYRIVEYANNLPPDMKLHVLKEKWILKQIGRRFLPPEIWQRLKRPYRAPVHRSFFPNTPFYVGDLLSERRLKDLQFFKPEAVGRLIHKANSGSALSEVEDMALAGVISTHLVNYHFIENFKVKPLLTGDRLKIVDIIGEKLNERRR